MLGATIVAAIIISIIAVTGGFERSAGTVTVQQEAPVVLPASLRSERASLAAAIYERAAPGVVFVSAYGVSQTQSTSEYLKGEGGGQGTATGSGFEVDDRGTIVTNLHVVDGASKIVIGLDNSRSVPARVIRKDRSLDIAVLRIPTRDVTLDALRLGDSNGARVGDLALAIGNPFGLGRTLTRGIVSGVQRRIQTPSGVVIDHALQTDAAINPGNSGGPLLNERGEVIGINSQIETAHEGGGSVGIAFAIPIDAVKQELRGLG